VQPDDWRELHRTPDLPLARTIVTTIEAMEFDARLVDSRTRAIVEDETEGTGPYAVEVRGDDIGELKDVLAELICEQVEFDERIEARQRRHRAIRAALVASVILAMLVLLWMRLSR
jgi:hypothetical protein